MCKAWMKSRPKSSPKPSLSEKAAQNEHWYLAKALATFNADPQSYNQISIVRLEMIEVSQIRGEWLPARKATGESGLVPSKCLCFFDAHLTMHDASRAFRAVTSQEGVRDPPLIVKAVFSYQADPAIPEEISFRKHEILQVTERVPGWWNARKSNGETGIVPSPYFVYAQDAEKPIPQSQSLVSYCEAEDDDDTDNGSETSSITLVEEPGQFDLLDGLDIAQAVASASDRPVSRIGTVHGWGSR